jgi:hypothetical protein
MPRKIYIGEDAISPELRDTWSVLHFFVQEASDILFTIQDMPYKENTSKTILKEYNSRMGERIHRTKLNHALNGLAAADLITFRRGIDEDGDNVKYVMITEKGRAVKY